VLVVTGLTLTALALQIVRWVRRHYWAVQAVLVVMAAHVLGIGRRLQVGEPMGVADSGAAARDRRRTGSPIGLNGAAMVGPRGAPVDGLTLRHDRIDNFWFTLLHELCHLCLHYDVSVDTHVAFVDDMEIRSDDTRELEADALASSLSDLASPKFLSL
jgi:IrrE N-terminal-like domain